MINNLIELNDTITALTKNTNISIPVLSRKMNSDEFNNIFRTMQENLNSLYEKCRLLEDLRNFTQSYIQNEFKKKNAAFNSAIKELEKSTVDYENITKIACEIPFNLSPIVTLDRDGVAIKSPEIIEGSKLLQSNTTVNKINNLYMSSNSSDIPYRQIMTPPENYRSFYIMPYPSVDGIKESLQIIFSQEAYINYLDIQAFGAKITDLYIIRSDNQIIKVDTSQYGINLQSVKGIQIDLSTNYFKPLEINYITTNDSYNKINRAVKQDVFNTIFETYQ